MFCSVDVLLCFGGVLLFISSMVICEDLIIQLFVNRPQIFMIFTEIEVSIWILCLLVSIL